MEQPKKIEENKIDYFRKVFNIILSGSEKYTVKNEIRNFRKDLKESNISLEEIGITEDDLIKLEAKGYITAAKEWYDLIKNMKKESNTTALPEDETYFLCDYAQKASDILKKDVELILCEDVGVQKEEIKQVLEFIDKIE